MSPTLSSVPLGARIFLLRLGAAVGSSAIFGLVAMSTSKGIFLLPAVFAAFVFGTAFVGGTGYRIIHAVLTSSHVSSPASWSGAAAASAIACLLALAFLTRSMDFAARLLLAYALAINFAYLAVKASCALAGCCHADVGIAGRTFGLRAVELTVTLILLALVGLLSVQNFWLAAFAGLAGHTGLRYYSREKRCRRATGWPPLRQPGAELAPLQLLTLIALVGIFS
jgi:hypothetical protein